MKALLFDKDGTLFDFRRSWAGWADRLLDDLAGRDDPAGKNGLAGKDGPAGSGGARAALAAAIGYLPATRDFRRDSVVIAGTADEVAAVVAPHVPGLGREEILARINALAAATRMEPAVPLRETLGALRARGLMLGLATNDAEAPARAHLRAHAITDLFDFVAGFDSGHGAKPGPGMPLAFLRATGLAPGDAAMVGDSLHDLVAGREAGMRTVAVLTGIARAPDLAPMADVVLADIGGLGGWLDGLGVRAG